MAMYRFHYILIAIISERLGGLKVTNKKRAPKPKQAVFYSEQFPL